MSAMVGKQTSGLKKIEWRLLRTQTSIPFNEWNKI
jgi:hypothetical protein